MSQSGSFDQVTGIKEISRELKARMRNFTFTLDEIKDRIENTAKCYHLLDKVRKKRRVHIVLNMKKKLQCKVSMNQNLDRISFLTFMITEFHFLLS